MESLDNKKNKSIEFTQTGKDPEQIPLKTLSPFTWTHLKLPPINPTKIKQNNAIQQKHNKSKTKKGNNTKLNSLNKTIDIGSLQEKKMSRELPLRYQHHENAEQRAHVDKANKIKDYKKHVILKHLQKEGIQEPERPINIDQNKSINRVKSPINSIVSRAKSPTNSIVSRAKSPINSLKYHLSQTTPFPNSFSITKIQGYIYHGLQQAGWHQNGSMPELVWEQKYNDKELVKGQISNHIKNGHLLTLKNNLHEFQSSLGSDFYPLSFSLPLEYLAFCLEYEENIVKIALKTIIEKANNINLISSNNNLKLCLATLLPKLLREKQNEPTIHAIKLALYLQSYRKKKNYRYFEILENYQKIETDLQPSVTQAVIKFCYSYVQGDQHLEIQLVQRELMELLWHYYLMLVKYEDKVETTNMWIVKPIASSRGAGIFLLKNSLEYTYTFCGSHEYSHLKKFGNKIIQKYIYNPFLIKEIPQYTDRKFDIRHWVLVACHKTNNPIVYVYRAGYCRFSQMDYKITDYKAKDQSKIHLTNYSLFKKGHSSAQLPNNQSILMLDELFEKQPSINIQNYNKQLEKIAIETIMNNKQLRFEKNRFELFGYDVLMDQKQKMWLLEINLNPACEAQRDQKLLRETNQMVKSMMELVRQNGVNPQSKWEVVFGKQNQNLRNPKKQERQKSESEKIQAQFESSREEDFNEDGYPNIKPFYEDNINVKDSLISQVRRRNSIAKAIYKIVRIINCPPYFESLKKLTALAIQQENEELNASEKQTQKGEEEEQKNEGQQNKAS